ncbi:hypothetical protein AVEN_222726-1 [Araneus ventricosus]|uniref:Uncharacterized protein n=1 Tax=Araneus ventricosus TaxID=182803 RepID=A0A4Y2B093_ARAVE|nr:hypothetical protein AVEN_222726-1 [Araneus ventricosus]
MVAHIDTIPFFSPSVKFNLSGATPRKLQAHQLRTIRSPTAPSPSLFQFPLDRESLTPLHHISTQIVFQHISEVVFQQPGSKNGDLGHPKRLEIHIFDHAFLISGSIPDLNRWILEIP